LEVTEPSSEVVEIAVCDTGMGIVKYFVSKVDS